MAGLEKERIMVEETLLSPGADFIARFMAVRNLHEILRDRPQMATVRTVTILGALFANPSLTGERQVLFLFREAAGALLCIFVGEVASLGEVALQWLYGVLREGSGAAQRAVCESLAGLPLAIAAPFSLAAVTAEPPLLSWRDLPEATMVDFDAEISFVGRSLVAPLLGGAELLVVKFARPNDSLSALGREAQWLSWLRSNNEVLDPLFVVPRALCPLESFLFRLDDLPITLPPHLSLHPLGFAIAFVAPANYYSYLNEPGNGLDDESFSPLLAWNAKLFAKLAGMGIIHDALIPLFHNRVQLDRREDGGSYDWVLGGRLDRWLASCEHPNLGVGGPRDFEHLGVIDDLRPGELYRQLGAHFLSMLLVAASYFRKKEPVCMGQHLDGSPVDARHLFDASLLEQVIEDMYRAYYFAFTGQRAQAQLPFSLPRLTSRMIEEMGVDHHMEEVLRLVDQKKMSDDEFVVFLRQRGFSARRCAELRRGDGDVVLVTGPHLGGFNQAISLPELVEAVGGMAAMCVLGRYQAENGLAESPLVADGEEALADCLQMG